MKGFLEIYFKRPIKRFFHVVQSQTESVKLKGPSRNLKLIAVTGTSGKSTTSSMIFHILKNSGYKTGLISTVEAVAGDKKIDTGLHVTTPDAKQLQQLLRIMVDEGMEYVVIETSSHALAQGRLGLLQLDFAVFTNIKRDHLDWHGTWENYAKAKAGLINKLKPSGKLVLNKDDKQSYDYLRHYYYSLAKSPANFIEYTKNSEVSNLKSSIEGLNFDYQDVKFSVPIIGEYNIENLIAAVKTAELIGISAETAAKALNSFKGVKGRMEVLQTKPFGVIVDFAHNTDSLEKSLQSVRSMNGVKNIISVFGSAGLRDKEKRFTMGEAAAKLSNIVVATSEDPRTESLFEINTKIIEGATQSGAKLVKRFSNHQDYLEYIKDTKNLELSEDKLVFAFDQETVDSRFDAIDFALRIAKEGDIVITQGKGHEQSLCFGTTEYPFTDQEAVSRALGK